MKHFSCSPTSTTINNNIYILFIIIIITTTFHFRSHRNTMIGYAVSLPKGAKVPALLVFGDSIVDAGNNNYLPTVARCNFLPYGRDFQGGDHPTGRFSNGKVPSDLFAEEVGVKELVPPYLDPTLKLEDLLTGVSFASGAAGYDPLSAKYTLAMPLSGQLELFKNYTVRLKASVGEEKTAEIISESIYFICSGSNDITNTYYFTPFRRPEYTISSYTDLMANSASNFFRALYDLGARRIGILSAPPLGCLPSQRTMVGGSDRKCVEEYNQAATLFNSKLETEIDILNRGLPGAKFVYLDVYNPLLHLIQHPYQSGFEVADRGCCGTGNIEVAILCTRFDPRTCTNASKYIFWDSFHPTEAAYRLLVPQILNTTINYFFE